MSFHEMAITIRAVNRASHEFATIGSDAERLSGRIKNVGSAIVGIGATGVAITHVAHCFGVLDDATARNLTSLLSVASAIGMLVRTFAPYISNLISAAAAEWGMAAGATAKWIAITMGAAAIPIATAMVLAYTLQTRASTAALNENTAALRENAATWESHGRSLRRAGEEEALRRRGVE